MGVIRVSVAFLKGAFLREYEKAYVSAVAGEIRQHGAEWGIALEDDASCADLIVLLPSAEYKTVDYIQVLENDPLVRQHAERVYVIDYDDHPEGMLAGLYTSIEHPFFVPELHRSWPILFMNNPRVYSLTDEEVWAGSRSRLFSFVGAASHALRKRLFAMFSEPSPDYCVQEIKRWYDHDEEDRKRYVQVALDSLFCLCPRGYTSYTNRIPEVMAMGRVPVVIADDWIPFSFGESTPYYIQVPERDVEKLPEILSKARGLADEYGRNARALWKKFCSSKRRVAATIESMVSLSKEPGGRVTYAEYRERWHSKDFLRMCGWTAPQRLALRAEQHVRRYLPRAKVPGVSPLMRYRSAPNMR